VINPQELSWGCADQNERLAGDIFWDITLEDPFLHILLQMGARDGASKKQTFWNETSMRVAGYCETAFTGPCLAPWAGKT
jgi:hypothetical protein